jgi:hypothetical protein
MEKMFSKVSLLTHPKFSTRKEKLTLLLQLVLLLSLVYPIFQPGKAGASVTESFVRFDRHSTGAAISGTACLKTGTSGTETNVVLVFPNTWTISQTAGNWTVTTSNLPTDPVGGGAATAWPGINTATSVNGLSVVFPGTDLSTATFYCFNFAGASSTIGAAGNDKVGQLKTQGGSPFVDSVDWATSVVSSNADQIVVTASVSASMTFSLTANSVSLGTLSTGAVTSGAAVTQSVSTNARNGWTSWVKSTNGGLTSAIASSTLSSPGSNNGTPESLAAQGGYVLDANLNSCAGCTINAEYDGGDVSSGGHLDAAASGFRETATQTAPASANTVDLVVRAKASATTPAASDYTDTLTVVAAGSF